MSLNKPLLAWKRKRSEVEARIRELEKIRSETVSWLEKASSRRTEMLWRRSEYLKFLQKQQRLNGVVKDTAIKLDAAKQELSEISKTISRLEKNRTRTIFTLGGIAVVLLMISLFAYGPFAGDSSLTGAAVSELTLANESIADTTITLPTTPPIFNNSDRDMVTIPGKPVKGYLKKNKTLDELFAESKIYYPKERIKGITQPDYATTEIIFSDKPDKTLIVHAPRFDGMAFSEFVPLQDKDDFTYTAAFEGTAVEIEFDSPEIKLNKSEKQFAKIKENSTDNWKIKYDFKLPSADFVGRIRISSNSLIEVSDPDLGEMRLGKFFLSFKAEKENGYTITTDQINDKIVFVYLAKDYTAEGKVVDQMIEIDPTLTLTGGTTSTLCGTVKNYSTIDVQSGGVLKICARNATNPDESGYVNISLGYFGNFSLSAGGLVEGKGAGGIGGAGCNGNSCTSTQGGNGTGQNGVAATTANQGGGGGATKGSANGDSAAGAGGGFGGFGGQGGLSASGTKSSNGTTYGSQNDERLFTGSGGGGSSGDVATAGGAGGGGFKVETGAGGMIWIQGTINVSGVNGTNQSGTAVDTAGAGGGSGGHVILKAGKLMFENKNNITVIGMSGGSSKGATNSDGCSGGGGGGGRILYVYETLVGSFPQNLTEGGGPGVGGDTNCNAETDLLGAGAGYNGTIFYNSTTFATLANVTSVLPATDTQRNISQTVEIGASINFQPAAVVANVTLPNGTIDVVPLGFYDSDKYNASYTIPLLKGVYNIAVIANDSTGLIYKGTTNMTVLVDCLTITQENVSLSLDQNVVSDGTCFNIQANDVTLDGKGYYINYSVNGTIGAGVQINMVKNAVVKNFRIYEANISQAVKRAINLTHVTNSTIINNSIYTVASGNLRLLNSSKNIIFNNFINNTGVASTVVFDFSSYNNVSSNIIESNSSNANGMFLEFGSNHSTIFSNLIRTNGTAGTGIVISALSTNNTVLLNNISTKGRTATGIAIQLDSFNNTIDSNTIDTILATGISLINTYNASNIIKSNNITTSGAGDGISTLASGILLQNTSMNYMINNSIITTGITFADGIRLLSLVGSPVGYNYFINNYINTLVSYEISDASDIIPSGGGQFDNPNYLIYNNSFGEITWIGNTSSIVSGTGMSFVFNMSLNVSNDQGIGLGKNLFIGNNVVAINLSAFTTEGIVMGINSTANITLKGLALPSVDKIMRLGTFSNDTATIQGTGTDCKADGTCTQTSYSGGILLFNATNGLGSFAGNFTVVPADALGPNVTNMTPALNSRFNFSTSIEIAANVTDSTGVSAVNVSILMPNGSIAPLTLSTTVLLGKYNTSYAIPNLTGFYNVSFGANDTLNYINSTEFTNFTAVNDAPIVYWVAPVHSQSITEGGIAQIINLTFNVSDANGKDDIDNSSAQIRISLPGETDRFNTSCATGASTATTIQFNCTVGIWYFDGAGSWTINVSIKDKSSTYAENRSTSFELLSTTAMTMSPNALTWATLELGRTNQTSNNDPIRINNTGNKNIAVGGITVAGYNLQGITTTTDFINAENFSIAPVNFTGSGVGTAECNGTQLFNGTSGAAAPQAISIANITRGNNSIDDGTAASGQEELFVCLRFVPLGITRQSYDTSGAHTKPWSIAVS